MDCPGSSCRLAWYPLTAVHKLCQQNRGGRCFEKIWQFLTKGGGGLRLIDINSVMMKKIWVLTWIYNITVGPLVQLSLLDLQNIEILQSWLFCVSLTKLPPMTAVPTRHCPGARNFCRQPRSQIMLMKHCNVDEQCDHHGHHKLISDYQ